MGHQSYVLVHTETTVSNPAVIFVWVKYKKLLKIEILEKINKKYDKKYFLALIIH